MDTLVKYNKKILSFQGLRGIAIFSIMISHCSFMTNSYGSNALTYFGAFGVEVFILLSGYLSYYNYSHGKRNRSIVEKIKKFYPLHIVTFIISLPLTLYVFTNGECVKSILKILTNLLLVNGWIPMEDFYFSFNWVSRYLSLVVFFLLISPKINKVIEKLKVKYLAILTMVFIVVELVWTLLCSNMNHSHWLIYICPLVRTLDYIIGAMICKVIKDVRLNKKQISFVFIIAMLVVMTLLISSLYMNSKYYYTVVWVIPSILMIGILAIGNGTSSIIRALFENPVIIFIGNISFELFLIHQLIIRYTEILWCKIGIESSIIVYIIAIIVSVLAAYVWQKVWKKIKGLKIIGDQR